MHEEPADMLRRWLAEQRGRGASLAARLGLPPSVVSAWASRRRPVPVEHAAGIEAFTHGAVTRQDLRPDDWREIWPELAESEKKPPPALSSKALAATETVAQGVAHV